MKLLKENIIRCFIIGFAIAFTIACGSEDQKPAGAHTTDSINDNNNNGEQLRSGSASGDINDIPFTLTYGVIGNLMTSLGTTVLALSNSPINCTTDFDNTSNLTTGKTLVLIRLDDLEIGVQAYLLTKIIHVIVRTQTNVSIIDANSNTDAIDINSVSESEVGMEILELDDTSPNYHLSGIIAVRHCP